MVTKYLFQFGFFPWNAHAVLRRYENKPYFPPRVLGLEKTDSYIKYDLVQLMALFFHRSQLLVSPCARPAGRHLPTHTPPTHPPTMWLQEARLGAVGPRVGLAILPGRSAARYGHASLLTSLLPSLCSATASGTTKRTSSPRTTTGAVGRRGLRGSGHRWDSRLRRAWGPRESQQWPGPSPRTTSRQK